MGQRTECKSLAPGREAKNDQGSWKVPLFGPDLPLSVSFSLHLCLFLSLSVYVCVWRVCVCDLRLAWTPYVAEDNPELLTLLELKPRALCILYKHSTS